MIRRTSVRTAPRPIAATAFPLLMRASTSDPLPTLLPHLVETLPGSGAIIRARQRLSPRAVSLRLEMQRHRCEHIYAALLASGLLLDRAAHVALAALCTQNWTLPAGRLSSLLEIDLQIHSSEENCLLFRAHPHTTFA